MKVFTLQILNNDVLSKKFCEVDLPELHQQSQNVASMSKCGMDATNDQVDAIRQKSHNL